MSAKIFTPPPTYADAKTMRGRYRTPYGDLQVCGCGYSGETFTITFSPNGVANDPRYSHVTWSSVNGWENHEQRAARIWREQYERLPKNARDLIEMVAPDFDGVPMHNRKAPDRLLIIVKKRLIRQGALEFDICSRCGGGGRYSYCERWGDTCFDCGGSGKSIPSTTKAIKAAKCENHEEA